MNWKKATLVFTTHSCEVLDQMGRQDNVSGNANGHIYLAELVEACHIRPALLKSKQYCSITENHLEWL